MSSIEHVLPETAREPCPAAQTILDVENNVTVNCPGLIPYRQRHFPCGEGRIVSGLVSKGADAFVNPQGAKIPDTWP